MAAGPWIPLLLFPVNSSKGTSYSKILLKELTTERFING
jgi:hypothetical protein